MFVILVIVLIALMFGFVFAKLDSLSKACKIIADDTRKLQEDIATLKQTQGQ